MKSVLSERNIVVILFVLVLITFSLAQEDSKKMEQMYSGTGISAVSRQLARFPDEIKMNEPSHPKPSSTTTE